MPHHNPTLENIRDFIARARNTLATQSLSIDNLQLSVSSTGQVTSTNTLIDKDFAVPITMSDKDRILKIKELNQEMFKWIDLLDAYDKNKSNDLTKIKENDIIYPI